MDYLYIALGLVGLFLGGEALVRGAVSIARRFAISPFVIGLTVVGFGTSTPELLVSVQAAFDGVPDIAIGNIVGSNIGNILLIVGLTALVWPIRIEGASLRRDLGVMLVAALVLVPVFAMAEIGRLAGFGLFAGLVGFLLWTFLRPGSAASEEGEEDSASPLSMPVALGWAVGGLVVLMLGARFLIDGSVSIARSYGISEAFIGLTIVAIGTSLPELATSLIAAFRKQSQIAIGNVIGSNIFNVLGILGITAMILPIPVAGRFLAFDLPVMIAASVLLAVLLLTRPVIGRGIGVAMLLAYGGYIVMAQ